MTDYDRGMGSFRFRKSFKLAPLGFPRSAISRQRATGGDARSQAPPARPGTTTENLRRYRFNEGEP